MSNPEDDLSEEQIRKMERNLLGVKPQRKGPIVVVSRRKSYAPKPTPPRIEIRAQRLGRWDEEEERLFDLYIVTDGHKTCRAMNHYRSEIMTLLAGYRKENPRIEVRWLDWRGRELPLG